MRRRANGDLSQLTDSAFIAEVAVGLGLIIQNARRLHASADVLAQAGRNHGARILHALSEEEATKFLILLDAVRCPRLPPDRLARQLARFNHHFPKGLYARACWIRPGTRGQLQEDLDHYRDKYYLDGPNDTDWIFSNDIDRRRQEALYVDYTASDEGHTWADPGWYDNVGLLSGFEPESLQIAGALYDVGISNSEAVAVVAEVWRSIAMSREMHWGELRQLNHRTLERLESKGLLQDRASTEYQRIVDDWPFPLYDLDLNMKEVDIELLRDRQRSWTPDW
jgi:AbiV family abortive infection protein